MKKLCFLLLGVALWGCQAGKSTTQKGSAPTEIDKDDITRAAINQTVRIKFDINETLIEGDSLIGIVRDGSHITITVSDTTVTGLRVTLTGRSDDASVKIYGNVPVLMEFCNVRLSSTRGAVVNCQSKKRLWLTYSGENHLADAAKYQTTEGEDCKGAIFSEGQIILCGDNSPRCEIVARGGHGIASDDYIRVMGGHWHVRSAKDGLHANDNVCMDDGCVSIDAESDGIDCKEGSVELLGGEIEISCVDDGISASHPKVKKNKKNKADSTTVAKPRKEVRADVTIQLTEKYSVATIRSTGPKGSGIKADDNIIIKGALDIEVTGDASKCINAGGCVIVEHTAMQGARLVASGKVAVNPKNNDTSSPKAIKSDSLILINGGQIYADVPNAGEGIESKKRIEINGGEVFVRAFDDALNAGTCLIINDGRMAFYSLHNDGIDSNGTIEINGGDIIAYGGHIPEAGIDCDMNRFAINGGQILGVGGATSTPTEGACTQPSIIVQNALLPTSDVIMYDASYWREPVDTLVCVPSSKYGTILLSNPDMRIDKEYTFECGDSTYKALPALGHKPMMPPPPPGGMSPFDGKMPPPPPGGFPNGTPPPPPPGGFSEGTPPPPPQGVTPRQ